MSMLVADTSESELRSLLIDPFFCVLVSLMELLWVAVSSASVAGWVLGALEVVEEEEEEDRKDFIVMLLEGPQEENLLAFRERLRRPVVLYPMREQEREREKEREERQQQQCVM